MQIQTPDKWPLKVRIILLGHDYGVFTRSDQPGQYPCECWYKDTYPDAFVFYNSNGYWVTSQQLELKSKGRAEIVR